MVSLSSASELANAGLLAYEERDFRAAIKYFLADSDEQSENWLSRLYLGLSYYKIEDLFSATRQFQFLRDNCTDEEIKEKAMLALAAANSQVQSSLARTAAITLSAKKTESLLPLDIPSGREGKVGNPVASNDSEAGSGPLLPVEKADVTVLIVDDLELALVAHTALINKIPHFKVIAVAINGEIAVQKVAELKPDVVLMDVELPALNGIEATKQISKAYPGTKVLIMSGYTDKDVILSCYRAGASGYVLKSAANNCLRAALETVNNGLVWVDPAIDGSIATEL